MFSGFVNNSGRITTCKKNNLLNLYDEKGLEMVVMEIALDFSMKNEFDGFWMLRLEYGICINKYFIMVFAHKRYKLVKVNADASNVWLVLIQQILVS